MRTIKKLSALLLAIGILVFYSCNNENMENQTGVRLIFTSSPAGVKSASLQSSDTVIITEAMIGVEKIKFKPMGEEDDDNKGKIVFYGPFAVDLLTGIAEPSINWAEVEPGLYKEIEFETEDVLDEDKALIIKGTITFSDQTETPFELITDDDFEIEVENDNGFTINEGVINDLLIIFNLSGLFDGIDLSSAVPDENGVLHFTDEINEDITEMLKEKFDDLGSCKENDDHDDDDHDDDDHDDDDHDDDDHDDDDHDD